MSNAPNNSTINTIIDTAKRNLKDSDSLQPVFFIVKDETVGLFPPDFSTDEKKDEAAKAVRMIVKKMDADFVFFLSESWIAACKTEEEMAANRAKYGQSLEGWPGTREVVLFRYETPSTSWSGMADILPDREMGEVEWKQTSRAEERGRFTNFFEAKEATH